MAAIEPSLIRALAAKRRPTSIDLGLGEPTLLPQQRFIDAAARETAERGMKYTLNAGDAELRALIAQRYAYPGMADARNVCVTNGSQEAMYVAIKTLLDPDARRGAGRRTGLSGVREDRATRRHRRALGRDAGGGRIPLRRRGDRRAR